MSFSNGKELRFEIGLTIVVNNLALAGKRREHV
jgi:hypothetical protein